ERIVDLAGTDVVEAEYRARCKRQIGRKRRRLVRRKIGAPGKEFVQEAAQMIVVRIGENAAALEQARRRKPAFLASLLEGLGFGLIAIGRVQQLVAQGDDLGRAVEARETPGPRRNAFLEPLLLFHPCKRELQRLL